MMRNLSENAGLSMPYTNHCVRATSIVHMREAGIQDRQIASVTGHKYIQSLVAYDRLSTKDCSAFAAAIDKSLSDRVFPCKLIQLCMQKEKKYSCCFWICSKCCWWPFFKRDI